MGDTCKMCGQTANHDKRIAFLVGSGISRNSKAPMVDELTRQVLEAPWKDAGDWKFYPVRSAEGDVSQGLAAKAQHLIRLVHDQIKEHLFSRDGRSPNYEDYFSCLKQIVEDETAKITNPLISKNVEALRSVSASLWSDTNSHIDDNKFASLVERACDLIQYVVFHRLYKLEPSDMGLFSSAAREFDDIDIFSLNHDRLIEKQFENECVQYRDGFGEECRGRRLFNRSWDSTDSSIRLFKLHGSVDWYQESGVDAKYLEPPRSSDQVVPNFLTGAIVKERAYNVGIFGDLFEQFRRRLRNYNTVFCSGYGWADQGINTRVREWLKAKRVNKVVVLHGNAVKNLSEKPFWKLYWEDYERAGKVIHVRKWFSACTVDDLRRAVRSTSRNHSLRL